MDSIVVGFDGTDASFVAADWVADTFAHRPCRIDIVVIGGSDLFADEVVDTALDEAERRVRNIAPDAEITSRSAPGRMPQGLIDAAVAADLLVVGGHRRPVRSALRGWRMLRTVAHSPIPVIVVPDDWAEIDGPVLVGVDDDDSSDAATRLAADEASARGAGLRLLHAWTMPEPTVEGTAALLADPAIIESGHRAVLEHGRDMLRAAHPTLDLDVILMQGDPGAALLSEADRSSLLVIGTHHRGVLEGALLGSVEQSVLSHTRTPVCVVPSVPPRTDAAASGGAH